MKSWLPVLLEKLPESPVLTLCANRNLARAALFDRRGQWLAGDLASKTLAAQAAEEAGHMAPGECRLLSQQDQQLTLECLAPTEANLTFWTMARDHRKDAWASWLLTMPALESGGLKLTRHILNAFGPWTTPRLPEELRDQWSLLPLNPGLGRLFVLGDDELAPELAGLAARTGLTTTWLTTIADPSASLAEARPLGDFDHQCLPSWNELSDEKMAELGLKEGVRLVLTAEVEAELLERLKQLQPLYLAQSGEGAAGQAGLFPQAATNTQRALGLIGEMLR